MAVEKLQSVRGMNDLLPADIGVWHRVEAALRAAAWAYGYQEIRTPVVEKTALFAQSIGDSSDIVQKEMYAFTDAGGDELALRPEATASTVRACNQHGLLHNRQQRLWYLGPMFRRERPQKGRYRQFHQFGIEAFGWAGPDIDAEVIRVGESVWSRLGIDGVELQLNTLGSPPVAAAYRGALRDYFAAHRDALDADSARRLETNPLRILDSKAAAMQELIAGAPDILAFLDAPARAHFDALCDSLRRAGVKYAVNPRLVRGLDYYTATVFEWVAADALGAQNAVCAGGRYDQLVETRGGRPTPAVGFALGIERLVELVAAGGGADDAGAAQVYVCAAEDGDGGDGDAAAEAVAVAELLRRDGFTVSEHRGRGKLAKQLRRASQSGARVAVITGLPGGVQAKPLRGQGDQITLGVDALAAWCRAHI